MRPGSLEEARVLEVDSSRRRIGGLGPRDARQGSFLLWSRFAIGAVGIGLGLFAYYAITWRSYSGLTRAIDSCRGIFCDFVSFYYPMGEAIFQVPLPIQGYVYSPLVAILLAAFPPLGLGISIALWGSLQVLSVVAFLALFRRLVPAGLPLQLLFVALVLSSFPILHNFVWGQVGVFMTIAVLEALVLYRSGHPVAAAVLIALAVSFKFFPVIFLAPFVARRDVRFLLLFGGVCMTFLILVPTILLGVDGTLGFYRALLDSYRNMGWVVANYNSQYLPHVILRLATSMGHDLSAYLPQLCWLAYSVAGANIGVLLLIQRARLPQADLWSFMLVFLTIPFVLSTSWPVDLVFLPFAQGFLAWRVLETERLSQGQVRPALGNPRAGERGRAFWARTSVTLLLLVASVAVSNMVFFNLLGDRFRYGNVGFIFWADLLLLVASYVQLLPPALETIRSSRAG